MDSSPKEISFKNEAPEPSSLDVPSNANTGNKSPEFSMQCSGIKVNFALGMTSANASRPSIENSESDQTHSLSINEDVFSENSSLDKIPNYKQGDGSVLSKSLSKAETEFLIPDSSSQPLSLSNISTNDLEDSASQEPTSPSSDEDCMDLADYYEDDEDKERYCEQMAIDEKRSGKETVKVENENLAASLPSSEEDYETISKFFLKDEEPTENPFVWVETPSAHSQSWGSLDEGDLLVQIQKFFKNNHILAKGTPLANSIVTSRFFTDEFARAHGLTVDESESTTADSEDSTLDSERHQERKPKRSKY